MELEADLKYISNYLEFSRLVVLLTVLTLCADSS